MDTKRSAGGRAPARKQEKAPDSVQADGVRLNVFLQERGVASRRKADEMIAAGRVSVDGAVVKTLGLRVAKNARVLVDGKALARTLATATYILNKPDLCLTSRSDPQGRLTVFDLDDVKKLPANVQAVGRLDFRSEGLLILTNDGDLAYALTHPKFSVEKTYACLVGDTMDPDEVDKLRSGVRLEDGFAKPISVRVGNREQMGAGKRGQWVEIVVAEGRNRLIRRMLDHLGHKVIRLVRIAIGDVKLSSTLKPGNVTAVTGQALVSLHQVRDEFLGSQEQSDSKTATGPSRRKSATRRKGLSDEAYVEERTRRSLESSKRQQERLASKPSPGGAPARSPARPASRPRPETSENRAPRRRDDSKSSRGRR
jgi:23S rRNA pseudouridine2605 synthase